MKFKNLLKNELIKIWRRVSVKVLVIIFLAVAAISSLANFSINGIFGGYSYDVLENIGNYGKELNSRIDAIKERAAANGVDKDDWRYTFVKSIANDTRDIYFHEESIKEYQEIIDTSTDAEDISWYKSYIAELQEYISGYEKNIEELWAIIEKNDFNAFVELRRASPDENLNQLSLYVTAQKEAVKNSPSGVYTDAELKALDNYFAKTEQLISTARSAFDSAIALHIPGNTTYMRLIDSLVELTMDYYPDLILKGDYLNPSIPVYTDYVISKTEKLQETLGKVAIIEYTVKNDVAEMTTAQSSRVNYQSLLTGIFFGLVTLLGIYVAGVCVASEFSKKTVNMLVIRPISRRMITLSKYLACLIFVLGTACAGLIIGFIFTGISNSFADFFQPYLYWNGSKVASVPYLLWYLGRALIASLELIFYTTLSFMLAMLTRHTTATMVSSFAVYAFSSILMYIRMAVLYRFDIISAYTYLPLSYIDIRSMVFHDVPMIYGYNYDLFDLLSSGVGIDLAYGSAMLIIMIGLMYFIADRSFKNRDIKQ